MPPTFRSSRSGRQFGDNANRTRTGQIDHDVFEGLPVRRWTRQRQTISQVPKTEISESLFQGPGGKQALPEHPMPRDSHLLTPMSRALLRAARAGCIYIRKAQKEPEDEEKEATDVEEQPMIQSTDRSFTARKWAALPRHLEPPEVEFLAKRRPGLPSLYGASTTGVDGAANNVPMRRTRFKKVDPVTGNISIYEAWVPEGHKIEGEITDEAQVRAENKEVAVIPEAPAPGTIVEGVGVVNAEGVVVAEAGSVSVMTPPKRRPPPPKRKAKGFGKGRRKKVMFAPGDGADAALVHGAGTSTAAGATDTGFAKADPDASRLSVDQSGQDEEEEEGDEGEESDEGDESMLDAKTPETPLAQPESVSAGDAASISVAEPVQESSTAIKEESAESQSVAPEGPSTLAKEPSTHTHVQPSAPPATLPSTQVPALPSADVSAPAPLIQPEATPVSKEPTQEVVTEDVVMPDAQPAVSPPDDSLATVPQRHPGRLSPEVQDVAEAAHGSTVSESPQAVPQNTESGPSPPVESAHRTEVQAEITEKSAEPSQGTPNEAMTQEVAETGDVIMEDPEAVPSAPTTEPMSLEETVPEQVPNSTVEPQPADTEAESNEVDLLGSLEASLGGTVSDAQTDGPAALQTDPQAGAMAAESTATNPAMEGGETVTDEPSQQPSEHVEEQLGKQVPEQIIEPDAEQRAIEQPTRPSLEPSTMSMPEQPEQETTEPTAETAANDAIEEHNQEAPVAQPPEQVPEAPSAVNPDPVAQPAEIQATESAAPQVMEPPADSSMVPSTEPSAEASSDQPAAPPTDQQLPVPSPEPHAEQPAQSSSEQSAHPTEPLAPSPTEQAPPQPADPSPEPTAPPTEPLTPPSPAFERIEETVQEQSQNQAPITDAQESQPAPPDESQSPKVPSSPAAPSAPEVTEPQTTQPSDAAPSDNNAAPQPIAEQEKVEPESKEGGDGAPAPSTSDVSAA